MYEYINQLMNKQINLFKHFNSAQFDSINSIWINPISIFIFISIIIAQSQILFQPQTFHSIAIESIWIELIFFIFFYWFIYWFIFHFYWFIPSFISSLRHINVSIAFDDNLLAYKIKCLVGSTFSSGGD